jgi:hypothetical protein
MVKTDTQVKSKERVTDHGEVFTAEREVKAMLDLVKQETERIDSRFLEPACGNGNFLAEILKRKLQIVNQRYSQSQTEWERYSIIAVSSIYGVDILEDNTHECQERLAQLFKRFYYLLFKDKCKSECINSIQFILKRNILWGDALNLKNPVSFEPLVFSEWSAVNGTLIKRRDFKLDMLLRATASEPNTLFSDLNFVYKSVSRPPGASSPIHHIHNRLIPLNGPATLSVKVDENLAVELQSKTLIVNLVKKPQGGLFENGYVTTEIRNFDGYYVTIDTLAPRILPVNLSNGVSMVNISKILFRISDNLS